MTEPAPSPAPDSVPLTDPAPGPSAASVSVSVSVNGEVRHLAAGTALDALVAGLTPARSGVAAAVNESVVPRGQWSATALRDGDRVEILTAVQGG
ncbi:sulfur carrier protein ThiS [Streptomyces sp. NPDC006971]|uniref:sulfur carrier protein ThiS n=1 Tax=Streptomyces sp. NPDC006971 TaxID=3154784 RepID=UPI00340EC447